MGSNIKWGGYGSKIFIGWLYSNKGCSVEVYQKIGLTGIHAIRITATL